MQFIICLKCVGGDLEKNTISLETSDVSLKALHEYVLSLPDVSIKYHVELTNTLDTPKGGGLPPANAHELIKKNGCYKFSTFLNKNDKVPFSIVSYDGKNHYYYTNRDKGLRIASQIEIDLMRDLLCGLSIFPGLYEASLNKSWAAVEGGSTGEYAEKAKGGQYKLILTKEIDVFDLQGQMFPKSVSWRFFDAKSGKETNSSYISKITKFVNLKEDDSIRVDFFKIPLSQCVRLIDYDLDQLQIELDNE